MALGGGQHARGLAIGLAEVAVGGAGDQTVDGRVVLHGRQEGCEGPLEPM